MSSVNPASLGQAASWRRNYRSHIRTGAIERNPQPRHRLLLDPARLPVNTNPQGLIMSKYIVAAAALAVFALSGVAQADPAGPADKKDSSSLSSGAKSATPAIKSNNSSSSTPSSAGAADGTAGKSNPAAKPASSDPVQSK